MPERLQLGSRWLIAIVLVACHGCGDNLTAPQPNIRTTLTLAHSIIAPGDTIVAIVRAANEGSAPASFLFYCANYLWTSIEDGNGECIVGCIAVCSTRPVSLELQPGEVLQKTFRHASVDWQGTPFPPGLYAVNGGIAAPGMSVARIGFVINEP